MVFALTLIGTISGFRAESGEIQVRPDQGEVVFIKVGPETVTQRVGPGETDLKKAASIPVTDLAIGDRVLVSFLPGLAEARRIVVMSASDIAKRQEAERQDWIRRGIFGMVSAVKGERITLRNSTVIVGPKTLFRRYAPDSVRFADALPSGLDEIRKGDQLRARGQKSPDGRSIAAEEVVFGTFITRTGSVQAVHRDAAELAVKDLETNRPLTIKLTADSQIKRMIGPVAPADLSQALERLPAARLADLKPGEIIVVSSTRGGSSNQITAIMLLANAGMLLRQQGPSVGQGMSPANLELPGMLP
jgi:hypothetical protein